MDMVAGMLLLSFSLVSAIAELVEVHPRFPVFCPAVWAAIGS